MEIDKLTIGEARKLAKELRIAMSGCEETYLAASVERRSSPNPYNIGANYFIRTVTFHHTGKLVEVTEHELVLTNAAWIADDGRLTDALKKCQFNEVEMFPDGRLIIGRGSIIDAVEITDIPSSQK